MKPIVATAESTILLACVCRVSASADARSAKVLVLDDLLRDPACHRQLLETWSDFFFSGGLFVNNVFDVHLSNETVGGEVRVAFRVTIVVGDDNHGDHQIRHVSALCLDFDLFCGLCLRAKLIVVAVLLAGTACVHHTRLSAAEAAVVRGLAVGKVYFDLNIHEVEKTFFGESVNQQSVFFLSNTNSYEAFA